MDIASAAVSMGFRMISWCVALVLKFISLFIGYIDVLDAGLTVLVVWGMMYSAGWNGWLGLALGLLTAIIVYIIFKHRVGFWIVSVTYSFVWGFITVGLVCVLCVPTVQKLHFWIWVAVITAWAGWSHYCARDREAVANLIAEEDRQKQAARTSQQPQAVQELWYDPRCGELRPINTKPLEAYEKDWEYKQMKIRMEREARTK